jgi:hypothetical protein
MPGPASEAQFLDSLDSEPARRFRPVDLTDADLRSQDIRSRRSPELVTPNCELGYPCRRWTSPPSDTVCDDRGR